MNESRIRFSHWLRGDGAELKSELVVVSLTSLIRHLAAIVIGCGLFGFVMGVWRSPLQGAYTAVKLPAILVLTALGNTLINGMFAPLLGVELNLKKTFAAVLASYSIASLILAAFAPLIGFLVWNLPPLSTVNSANRAHHALLLVLVIAIAFAGTAANRRLLTLIRQFSPDDGSALRLLWSWLTINFLLGSQLSWILRPFIGSPQLVVQFFRSDALHGNFYATLAHTLKGFFDF